MMTAKDAAMASLKHLKAKHTRTQTLISSFEKKHLLPMMKQIEAAITTATKRGLHSTAIDLQNLNTIVSGVSGVPTNLIVVDPEEIKRTFLMRVRDELSNKGFKAGTHRVFGNGESQPHYVLKVSWPVAPWSFLTK